MKLFPYVLFIVSVYLYYPRYPEVLIPNLVNNMICTYLFGQSYLIFFKLLLRNEYLPSPFLPTNSRKINKMLHLVFFSNKNVLHSTSAVVYGIDRNLSTTVAPSARCGAIERISGSGTSGASFSALISRYD